LTAGAAASFAGLEKALAERRRQVDAVLLGWFVRGNPPGAEGLRRGGAVAEAVRSSLEAPAKRLRPVLALLVTEVFGGKVEPVLPAACAVEMVHTSSLILDDLPCMDDAKLRRGRPACHLEHGEANAILAAFALQNRAFQLLAEGWEGAPETEARSAIARELANAIGMDGMIAGQAVDLDSGEGPLDFQTLEFIHSRKTGALFTASAALGAVAARAGVAERAAVRVYAKNLGLAFQIVDDLIDVTGGEAEVGKDVGQDLKKTTFVSFSGAPGAVQLARELSTASQRALEGFGDRAEPLRELARYVVSRRR
jgi:geranylgeranyl diphosphate synthase type II